MANSAPQTIKLLNKRYTLRCPVNQEHHLQLAAEKLDKLMRQNQQKFPSLEDHKLLLLAALEISHELVSAQSCDEEESEQEANQVIHSLEARLQKVISLDKHAETHESSEEA